MSSKGITSQGTRALRFPVDWIVYKVGTVYYGKNALTGEVPYYSATLGTVLNLIHSALPNRGGNLFLAGELALTAAVKWQKPTVFFGGGAGTTDIETMYKGQTQISFGNHTAFEVRNKAIQFRDIAFHGPGKTSTLGKAIHVFCDFSLLTSDAAAGQKIVNVADGTKFIVGQRVGIFDDNAGEGNEIASINGNQLTMVNNLANTYTVAANGFVRLDINQNVALQDCVITDTYYPVYMSGKEVWNIGLRRLRIDKCYDAVKSVCSVKTNIIAQDVQAYNMDHDFMSLTMVDAIFLEDCHAFAPLNNGLEIASFFNGSQVLRGCQFDNCGNYALIAAFASLTELFIYLSDCWLKSHGASAVYFNNVRGASFSGGKFYLGNNAAGHNDVSRFVNCEDIRIKGVELRNTNTTADRPIELENSKYCAIIGNTVWNLGASLDYLIKEVGTTDDYNTFVGNIGRGNYTKCVGRRAAGTSIAAHNYGGED